MTRLPSILLSAVAASVALAIDESAFAPEDTITKDVAILGGGASGTFAAVRLREDMNVSVVVIEPDDHLGGHVNTYQDPISNTSIDYGVQCYLEYGNSRAFFDRFSIPLKPYPRSALTPVSVDIATGSNLTKYTAPNGTFPALATWLNVTEKYANYMLPGYWDFPPGAEIPAELLEPFGTVAARYGIEDAMPLMASISNVGVGGISEILTFYVMQAFGKPITEELLASSLFVPESGSNSLLYIRALSLLHKDVLLQSRVIAAERNDAGIKLITRNSFTGKKTLIKARKLLFTPSPTLANLGPLDVDAVETDFLTKWAPTWSFVGVARIPSLAENVSVSYFAPEAAPDNYLAIRDWPWTLRLDSTGPVGGGLFRVLFAADFVITTEEAQQLVSSSVENLFAEGNFEAPAGNGTGGACCSSGAGTCVEFMAWADHNSVLWRQEPEVLRAGFVQDLYSLQGKRSTWFTGALWSADYTGNVWAFTDELLPRLVASLRGK